MNQTGFTTNTKVCSDCHIDGSYQAPIISNHKPPKQTIVSGGNIITGAYCSTCHNNSINRYAYSVNASVGHYGTNASLVKPTVNQTARPVNGFMNPGDALSYNKECNNCHNPANTSYGNPQLISTPHTPTATCNQCHVDTSATDLHNSSLRIPAMGCLDCHTTNASRNRAPNLTNTYMVDSTNCDSTSCHGTSQDNGNDLLDTLNEHNINRNERGFTGRGGYTDTVYLNGQTSLTVPKGAIVTITSRVNDTSGSASRVGGAEYYYSSTDPGNGSGIPMNAVDGQFDAVNRNWEDVTATLDTSSLTAGTYIINVRGADIGKQWSTTKTAILTVTAMGYINGTVTNGTSPVSGVYVSTIGDNYTTGPDGKYSLKVDANTYTVTATKQPTHYDNITSGIVVTQSNTTIFDIVLTEKPKGTITGTVRNA
ncbi:MAG: multiheme c-type cytochrome [Candidatus Methanoperedens sp.]|nr:multiheme c-type cytochrome [Candidatus Methanoperedens sp.]